MTLKTRSSKVELSEIETFPYTTFLKSCVIKNIERYYRIRIFLETFCCEVEYYSSTVRRNQVSPPVTWNLEINLKATRISLLFSLSSKVEHFKTISLKAQIIDSMKSKDIQQWHLKRRFHFFFFSNRGVIISFVKQKSEKFFQFK